MQKLGVPPRGLYRSVMRYKLWCLVLRLVDLVVCNHKTREDGHHHLTVHFNDVFGECIDTRTNLACHWDGVLGIVQLLLQDTECRYYIAFGVPFKINLSKCSFCEYYTLYYEPLSSPKLVHTMLFLIYSVIYSAAPMGTFHGAVLSLFARCQHLFPVHKDLSMQRLTLSSMAQENANKTTKTTNKNYNIYIWLFHFFRPNSVI